MHILIKSLIFIFFLTSSNANLIIVNDVSKNKNYNIIKIENFDNSYYSNGIKFESASIALEFKKCDKEFIFLRINYIYTTQHANIFSDIIKIYPENEDLLLNIFKAKIVDKIESKKNFLKGKKFIYNSDIEFKNLEIHKEDFICLDNIKKNNKSFIGHYKKIFKKNKYNLTFNMNKINKISKFEPHLIFKDDKVYINENKLYGNFYSSEPQFTRPKKLTSESELFENFYKKPILGFYLEDLYKFDQKNENLYITCRSFSGNIVFLRIRKSDKKILNYDKCFKKKNIKYEKKIEDTLIIVISENSAYNYRQSNFTIELFKY